MASNVKQSFDKPFKANAIRKIYTEDPTKISKDHLINIPLEGQATTWTL